MLPLRESVVTGGSGPENEIALPEGGLPDLAFRLAAAEGGWTFTLAGASCKAFVNGKRCDSALLVPGDRLEIGGAALVLDHWTEEVSSASHDPLEGLSQLCALVAEERDLKPLLEKILGLLREWFRGDEAFFFVLDEKGRPRVYAGSGGEEHPRLVFSDSVVSKVLREGKATFVANALADPEFSRSESITALRLRSVLCCPITAGGRVSGLAYVGSRKAFVSYSEADLRELQAHALIAGCLINHVDYIALQGRMLAALGEPDDLGMLGQSPAMRQVRREADAVAAGDISVLLQGETGTGKDVLAQYIHRRSRRRDQPFLAVNCSTLRGELFASELFGHRKGAFTGALGDQPGLFLSADGGTLFLDEIGEMDLPLQAMLLRALESGLIRPVGQAAEIRVDVRILSATNRNLEELVDQGRFRSDLYYRINQHLIRMPPLRERGDDVALLAHHFLERAKLAYPGKVIAGFHPESLFAMARYSWPGNVRELSNAVHKAVLFADGPAVRIALPEKEGAWAGFEDATRRFQADYLLKALGLCGGDKDKAAAMLRMGRSTFFRHLAQARGETEAPGAPAN